MITKIIWDKEYSLTISWDDWYNPREDSNLWTMLYSHRNYILWDEILKNNWNSFEEDFAIYINNKFNILERESYYALTDKEIDKIYKWIDKNIIYLPLYLYDHSWITINTTWFSCRWDSWQVWYIYVHRDNILKEFNTNKLYKKFKDKTYSRLRHEVKVFDKYLQWDFYYFSIEERDIKIIDWKTFYWEWETVDSCWWLWEVTDILEYSDIFTKEEIESCNINY